MLSPKTKIFIINSQANIATRKGLAADDSCDGNARLRLDPRTYVRYNTKVCRSEVPGSEIADLRGSVERVLQRSREGRTPAGIRAELGDIRYLVNLLELEFSAVASEFAATD
jgi:hypothetical protein